MRTRLLVSFLLVTLAAFPALAQAMAQPRMAEPRASRIYILRGLGGEVASPAMDELGERLKRLRPDLLVRVAEWDEWQELTADAFGHPEDRIVLIGFSMGAQSAGRAANRLASRAVPVTVIGVDPMCAEAAVRPSPYVRAINFYGNLCGARGRMAGAINVRMGAGNQLDLAEHLAFPERPDVQAAIIREALGETLGY